jgi:hypothetical protein
MSIITTVFVALLIIVLIISVIYFLHFPVSPKDKALLISIRIMLIAAIALAFFEPELSLNKFSTSKRSVALLIDNSKSMTGFSPEQTVIAPVNKILKTASTSKKISVTAFTFGDTLQPHLRFDQKAFSATQSEFPDIKSGELFSADNIIVFSDGNWSSSAARINKLYDRQVYYLPLNTISRRTRIDMESSFIDSITHGNECAFKTSISGYLTKKDICTLTVTDNNRLFKSKVIAFDSGSIDSTIVLPFVKRISGKHLFKTTLFNKDSSLIAQVFSVVSIPPKQFTYTLYSTLPSLDQRFFTLALKKHPEFKKASPPLADLSIFTGPQNDLHSVINKIPSHSICAFIGVSQCGDSFTTISDHFNIVQNQSFIPPLPFTIPHPDLPPPSALPVCRPELENASTFLYLSDNNTTDPYPLLSFGNFLSHSALSVNFLGLWRWDFWPMSTARGEEEPFLFSEYLIALCKEMIISKTGSDLFAFPDFDKSGNDSLVFAVSLPSELPLSQSVSLELRLLSPSGKPIHMSISKLTTTGSLLYIKTPFPSDSTICYDVALKHTNKQFRYQDCFINQYANRELLVDNQNTLLLNQFAQPLQLDSDSVITTFFANLSNESKPLIKQVLPLRRTWWLIALILILFSTEWYLRKKIE